MENIDLLKPLGYILVVFILGFILFFNGKTWEKIKNIFKRKEVIICGEIYDSGILSTVDEKDIYLIVVKNHKHKYLVTTNDPSIYESFLKIKGTYQEIKILGLKSLCFENIEFIKVLE